MNVHNSLFSPRLLKHFKQCKQLKQLKTVVKRELCKMLILFTLPGKSEVWSIVTNFLGGDVLHDLDQLRGAAAAHCARILRSGTRITF